MLAVSGIARKAGTQELVACGLLSTGGALLVVRSPAAPFLLMAGLAALLLASRAAFVAGAVLVVPVSTVAWDVTITNVGGRVFDARLVITFGVAALVAAALLLERPRLRRLELLVASFAALLVLLGLLRSESLLTWAPPAARWFSYAGFFVLGRACVPGRRELTTVAAAATVGFAVPAAIGTLQYVMGHSATINDAVRATAPGGRGPIGLAFAGEMVLVLAAVLAERGLRWRWGWYATAGVGLAAVIASATRLVTLTAFAAFAAIQAASRRWRVALAVPVVLAAAVVVARPDLLDRYLGTGRTSSPTPAATQPTSVSEETSDTSTSFRRFVWHTLLDEWRERPILGIGPGMTAPTIAAVSPARRVAPHNDYIGVLAEEGIVGLALFLALQGAVVAALLRRVAHERWRDSLPVGVLALFVAVNIFGALNNAMYFFDVQVPLWALAGAALGAATAPAVAHRPSSNSSTKAANRATAGPGSRAPGAGRRSVSSS